MSAIDDPQHLLTRLAAADRLSLQSLLPGKLWVNLRPRLQGVRQYAVDLTGAHETMMSVTAASAA
uniref:hypothetical protein n=1 Tax=Corynebacterium jeikeium TaxID=38289 RepID=UPI001568BC68|nr:hypothetical protein [Corynebacterium jeikeium]